MNKQVDVVIPLYNGARWIHQTLDSVFNQTLKPGRVIIVDDGSTDNSREIVAQIPNVTLLKNYSNQGTAAAREHGLRNTSAPFVAFLDQDDVWHAEHLRILYEALNHYPEVPAAASNCKTFYNDREPTFELGNNSIKLIEPWRTYPYHHGDCSPSFTLFRRQPLSKIGWTVEHNNMSDYSVWMKLSVKNPLIRVQTKTVAYRRHDHNHTKRLSKNPWACFHFRMKVIDDLLYFRLGSLKNAKEELFLRKRNSIAHIMGDLIIGTSSSNKKLLKKKAFELEASLHDESAYFRKLPLSYLIDFLSMEFFTEGRLEKVLAFYNRLFELWPEKAPLTRRTLINVIAEKRPGISFYLKYYLNKPWQFRRIIPFFIALRKKVLNDYGNS